ncbi:hypothetical protein VOLCADRAFT_117774 [Volvox carteri f. nagariensis]|uniref:Uncharacterized protein n=1 Tax=Volvox carteri f. nagariensis TaxID=3068 RepID=D8TXM6_VOLCA|nr:uncharacterized protein VOLCADRAFT_117774 [Volvox carteri f. nagariensis]EFJ47751.1 hypothetical protein VOLCADRAFT_117774 [Volvox carteri f. nagariensis]|eukprot:XP_002951222.1 hypothetical protein VOLCADRAFT_117774 [Volvox carteri f. nagariensis]
MLKSWFAMTYEQLTWAEVSGSLGDLGTFLPLLIALVQKVDLDLGTTLIVTGMYNIVSGVQFGIPMCVQPMKTIAAVALAASELLLAGVFVSGCVLVLGLTRLIDVFNWLVPPPVVRGVQLAVGAKLAMKGLDMAFRQRLPTHGPPDGPAPAFSPFPSPSSSSSSLLPPWPPLSSSPTLAAPPPSVAVWRPVMGSEGFLVAAMALGFLLVTTMAPRVSRPDSPDAAEEGSLGPPPADTPFGPLLQRLMTWRRTTPASSSSSSSPAPPQPANGTSGGIGGGDGDGGGGGGGVTETNWLIATSNFGSGFVDSDGNTRRGAEDPELAAAVAMSPSYDADAAGGSSYPCRQQGGCSASGGGGGGSSSSCGGGGRRGFPSALVTVVAGLLMAVVSRPRLLAELKLGPSTPRLLQPNWSDVRQGAVRAGLPQLPLTTLNSVIAVVQLANSLFPDRRDSSRWSPTAVALSVALMNLCGCWLGAMPCCHGAGGLAAQYKFGARSGSAPVLLGCLKAALGLAFGGSLAALLAAFPQPLLGALLLVSGVELASVLRHMRTPRGYSFALITAVAILGLDDTGTGFLMGLAAVAVVGTHDAVSGCLMKQLGGGSSGGSGDAGGGGGGGGGKGGGWCCQLLYRWRRRLASMQTGSRTMAASAGQVLWSGGGAGIGRGGSDGTGGGPGPTTDALYDKLEDVDLDGGGDVTWKGSGIGGGGGRF